MDLLFKKQRNFFRLSQAEATRERLATELQTLPEKTKVMKEELVILSDLEKLRDEGNIKKLEFF